MFLLFTPHLHTLCPPLHGAWTAHSDQYGVHYYLKIGWLRAELVGQWRISTGIIDEEPLTHLVVQPNNLAVEFLIGHGSSYRIHCSDRPSAAPPCWKGSGLTPHLHPAPSPNVGSYCAPPEGQRSTTLDKTHEMNQETGAAA